MIGGLKHRRSCCRLLGTKIECQDNVVSQTTTGNKVTHIEVEVRLSGPGASACRLVAAGPQGMSRLQGAAEQRGMSRLREAAGLQGMSRRLVAAGPQGMSRLQGAAGPQGMSHLQGAAALQGMSRLQGAAALQGMLVGVGQQGLRQGLLVAAALQGMWVDVGQQGLRQGLLVAAEQQGMSLQLVTAARLGMSRLQAAGQLGTEGSRGSAAQQWVLAGPPLRQEACLLAASLGFPLAE